jgi:hypothetical protein
MKQHAHSTASCRPALDVCAQSLSNGAESLGIHHAFIRLPPSGAHVQVISPKMAVTSRFMTVLIPIRPHN